MSYFRRGSPLIDLYDYAWLPNAIAEVAFSDMYNNKFCWDGGILSPIIFSISIFMLE